MSGSDDFMARRQAARDRLDALEGAKGGNPDNRNTWFNAVYETAGGDAANVPWADLAPKPELVDWLANNPGNGKTALDVACGIGDNAEALAAAGYRTTAFDIADAAIAWASDRFSEGNVVYKAIDMFAAPTSWQGGFDLVHECYTVQALHGEMREKAISTIASFVAPGGCLVVITRTRETEGPAEGPPWPLSPRELDQFGTLSLTLEDRFDYTVERGEGRFIPHARLVFRRA